MNAERIARLCRISGLTAIIVAPIPFLVFFYRLAITKINDIPQDRIAYNDTYWSAFLWVAGVGFVLGCALLLFGWRLRSKPQEVAA